VNPVAVPVVHTPADIGVDSIPDAVVLHTPGVGADTTIYAGSVFFGSLERFVSGFSFGLDTVDTFTMVPTVVVVASIVISG
jgi:hypothetical protein